MARQADVKKLDTVLRPGSCSGNWRKGYSCGSCPRCRAIATNAVALVAELTVSLDQVLEVLQSTIDRDTRIQEHQDLIRRAVKVIGKARSQL